MQLNVLQVGREEELTADVAQRPPDDPRLQPPARPDRHRRRRRRRARASRRPIPAPSSSSSASTRRGDLFANITGYYTFNYGSTQLERTQNDVLTGNTEQQELDALRNMLGGGTTRASCRADDAHRRAARRQAGARRPRGLGRGDGPDDRRDPRDVQLPRRTTRTSSCSPTAPTAGDVLDFLTQLPRQAAAGERVPGAVHAGVELQGRSRPASRSRTASPRSSGCSPTRPSGCRRRPTTRSRTTAAPRAAARWSRSSTAAATSRSRRWRSSSGRSGWSPGTQAWGIGEKLPIDLPAPWRSAFGEVADFADQLPLLAIGGFGQANDVMVPLHMAMVAATVANGGQMMEPYVVDAHAVPRRQRARPDRARRSGRRRSRRRPPSTLTTLMIGVVNQGTGRAMQLADGIQAAAKTGTAQLNAAGEPQRSHAWIIGFAPAEAPRYAVAVVLKGTERRDQREHRRQARRTDREAGARLPVRAPSAAPVGRPCSRRRSRCDPNRRRRVASDSLVPMHRARTCTDEQHQ